MDSKTILQSKTLAFNALVALLAFVSANSSVIQEMMTPERFSVLMLIVAAINGVLRFLTTKPIEIK